MRVFATAAIAAEAGSETADGDAAVDLPAPMLSLRCVNLAAGAAPIADLPQR